MSLTFTFGIRHLGSSGISLVTIVSYPNTIQRQRHFAILHEPAPDVAGAHVFGAEKNDADVDADDVCIDPAGFGIEGVDETVPAIDLLAILLSHRAHRRGGEFRSEHQRTACR